MEKFISLSGSYLYSIQIRPKPGVTLLKWNLLDFVPEPNEWNGEKAYFAMVTHGLEAPPLQVHLEFDVNIFDDFLNKPMNFTDIF